LFIAVNTELASGAHLKVGRKESAEPVLRLSDLTTYRDLKSAQNEQYKFHSRRF